MAKLLVLYKALRNADGGWGPLHDFIEEYIGIYSRNIDIPIDHYYVTAEPNTETHIEGNKVFVRGVENNWDSTSIKVCLGYRAIPNHEEYTHILVMGMNTVCLYDKLVDTLCAGDGVDLFAHFVTRSPVGAFPSGMGYMLSKRAMEEFCEHVDKDIYRRGCQYSQWFKSRTPALTDDYILGVLLKSNLWVCKVLPAAWVEKGYDAPPKASVLREKILGRYHGFEFSEALEHQRRHLKESPIFSSRTDW